MDTGTFGKQPSTSTCSEGPEDAPKAPAEGTILFAASESQIPKLGKPRQFVAFAVLQYAAICFALVSLALPL